MRGGTEQPCVGHRRDGSPVGTCLFCTSVKVGRRDGRAMLWRDEVAAVEVVVRLLADTAGRQVSHATVAGGSGRLLNARVVQVQAIVGVGRSRCWEGHEVLGSGGQGGGRVDEGV